MSECSCHEVVCEACEEESRKLSEHTGQMIQAMSLIPTQSGTIMQDIFGMCFAANIASWKVAGKDGECPTKVAYEFADGTKITWTRPRA